MLTADRFAGPLRGDNERARTRGARGADDVLHRRARRTWGRGGWALSTLTPFYLGKVPGGGRIGAIVTSGRLRLQLCFDCLPGVVDHRLGCGLDQAGRDDLEEPGPLRDVRSVMDGRSAVRRLKCELCQNAARRSDSLAERLEGRKLRRAGRDGQ